MFRTRVALPFALSANYDALVSDGQDNVLVAITGQNGNGIAVIDLTSLPEALPLPYSSLASSNLARMRRGSPPRSTGCPKRRSARQEERGHAVLRYAFRTA